MFILGLRKFTHRADWRKAAVAGPDWGELSARTRLELEQELPRLEQHFLAISDRLEPVAIQTQSLVGKCEAMLRLAAGIDSGNDIVHRTLALLQGPLTYIDRCVQQRANLLKLLAECEAQTLRMIAARAQMQHTLEPLTYIAVLFKIESARLPADLREAFVTVTGEIERMRTLVDESVAHNTGLLQSAQATLHRIRVSLEREFTRVAEDVTVRRQRIEDAMKLLDTQMAHNAARDLRLHKHSQEVSAEVSRIVEKLQFQDIVHQKCMHVVEALSDASDSRGVNAALQAGQLEAVAADLSAGQERIADGLHTLSRKTQELEDASSRLDDLQGMTAASDGIVQLLLETVGNVREITQVVADLTGHTYEAMGPLEGLEKNLTFTLSEVAVNMNIIALNSQIRSVAIKSGTGLEQLSARTAQISAEVNALSDANTENLERLGAVIAEMLATFKEFRESGTSELARFDQARSPAENDLHEIRDATLAAFQTIGATIVNLRREIDSATAAVVELESPRAAIAAVAAELGEFRLGQPMTPEEIRQLTAQGAKYTMDSERVVLARILGSSFEGGHQDTELFGGEAAAAVPSAPNPAPTPAPATSAPDLFEPVGSSSAERPASVNASVASPPPKAAPSLPQAAAAMGGNIELF